MSLSPILRAYMHYRCKRPTASSVRPTVPLPTVPMPCPFNWIRGEGGSDSGASLGDWKGGDVALRRAHFIFNSFSRRTSAAAFHLPFVYFANWVSSRPHNHPLPPILDPPSDAPVLRFPQIKQKTQPKKYKKMYETCFSVLVFPTFFVLFFNIYC